MQHAFNLVHLTDFHLFQPRETTWRDFTNKRLLSYLSWRLHRGRLNSTRLLSAILDFLPALAWDQVVVTGDLTHLGLPRECRLARRHLEKMGPPERVFVIPGNHDAMVLSAAEGYRGIWREFMTPDEAYRHPQCKGQVCHPSVRIRRGIALIGLSTALPTPPFSAAGRLGNRQRRRLAAVLDATGKQGLFRVVLIHHPILPGQVSSRKGLRDAAELRRIVARCGAELILHGHTHRHSYQMLAGPVGAIPVVGLPSSSAQHASAHKRACLRVYAIRPENGGWQIKVHDYGQASDGHIRPVIGSQGLHGWHANPNIAP